MASNGLEKIESAKKGLIAFNSSTSDASLKEN
jgi:hypothetical protein